MIYPLFTHRETNRATERWQHCPWRQPFTVEGERSPARPNDELSFEFCDAGHVLGAAGVLLRAEGRTIFYTGDVNFDDQTLTQGAVFPEIGDRCPDHRDDARRFSARRKASRRAAEEAALRRSDRRGLSQRGGCILVPVFALGKTQEVLAMLYKFKRAKMIDDVPIYIGGLSSKMTEIYDRRANTTPRGPAAAATVSRSLSLCSQRQNDRGRAGPAGSHLCALQRHDDAEDALQHLRAPCHRPAGTFDLFRRLRRSGIARRNLATGSA